ncbi:MAG: TonB-dependent receptor [Pseudomonadota bacterium]
MLYAAGAQAREPDNEYRLDTVVVSGQRLLDRLESQQAITPGGVTIVDGEDLSRRGVNNLADMLRYVPGLFSESASGGDEVFFSSRGSNLDATDYDGNGIKLLQDGLAVTTADGNNHNRIVDPLAARYAVIARGANALAYGASTLGGAIDFHSPTARDIAPVSIHANGGSNGQANLRLSAGAVEDNIDGLVTVEGRNWDGYRDHSEQQRYSLYANAGWKVAPAFESRLFATYQHNDQQLPGALSRAQVEADRNQASAAAVGGNYQKDVETWRIASINSWLLVGGMLEFGLSYEHQSLYHPIVDKILVDFDGAGPAQPVEVYSLLVDTHHRDVGAMLRYRLELGAHQLLTGFNYANGSVRGGNYRNAGGEANGLTEKVDNASNNLEAFVVDHWQFANDWTAVYGAQLVLSGRDVRTTDAATGGLRQQKAQYSDVNPRIGLIRKSGAAFETFASVSRSYEPPTSFDLADDVRGDNSTLDAMHGIVYEAGVRGGDTQRANLRWELTAYYARIHDEILSIDDPAAPGNSLSTNIKGTTHAGLEGMASAEFALPGGPTHRIAPRLSVTLNKFKFTSDPAYGNNALPAAPNYVVRGELLYRNVSGFYAGPTFDLVGRRYSDFANTYRVGSYGLLGLRTGFAAGNWEIFGEVRNLLDRNYFSTLSVKDLSAPDAAVLYPGAPRSLMAGFSWNP